MSWGVGGQILIEQGLFSERAHNWVFPPQGSNDGFGLAGAKDVCWALGQLQILKLHGGIVPPHANIHGPFHSHIVGAVLCCP